MSFKELRDSGFYIGGPNQIKFKRESPFDYMSQLSEFEFIPDFAKVIFNNPYINNEDKQYVLDNIVIPYLTDPEYRQEIYGKTIAFS